MSWAGAVTRYFMSDFAASVSWNRPKRSPAPSSEPANWVLMSGKGKKLKSVPAFLALKAPRPVMKLAWWKNSQPGGLANSGSPPPLKSLVGSTASVGSLILATTSVRYVVNAALISGELHLVLPAHQLLYTSGPAWRRTRSSIQSVPGQPDAAPLPSRRHHSAWALPWLAAPCVLSSSQVL